LKQSVDRAEIKQILYKPIQNQIAIKEMDMIVATKHVNHSI